MTNKRPFDDEFNMPLLSTDLRKEFLAYLNQPESCELFYNHLKSEHLAYVLEFYLACDGLKNLIDKQIHPRSIIELIYKYYLSNGKSLSSPSNRFSLPNSLLLSIKQRLIQHEFHYKFYDQAQEYVLKYMLQIWYPKIKRLIHRNRLSIKKKVKQQSNFNSVINENQVKCQSQYNLAQQNPSAFFEELKIRLLAYQNKSSNMIEDDPSTILDLQIAKTIDEADTYLFENSINYFQRYDSGVGTDSSEKNSERLYSQSLIDVIWYPSLDSNNALLSTIPYQHNRLTFKEFRQLFKKQTTYRYFFKTICTPDINKEQYVFRELTMDNELIPFYDGKIFVQLDRIR